MRGCPYPLYHFISSQNLDYLEYSGAYRSSGKGDPCRLGDLNELDSPFLRNFPEYLLQLWNREIGKGGEFIYKLFQDRKRIRREKLPSSRLLISDFIGEKIVRRVRKLYKCLCPLSKYIYNLYKPLIESDLKPLFLQEWNYKPRDLLSRLVSYVPAV